MLQNSSSTKEPTKAVRLSVKWRRLLIFPAGVLLGFIVSQIIAQWIFRGLTAIGVSFESINQNILSFIAAALIYALSIVLVLMVPWFMRKYKTTKEELGLSRLLSWMDLGLAPAGFIGYILVSALAIAIVGQLVPSFDSNQVQELPFTNLSKGYEYLLAFTTLVVVAPFAEEVLFRGYLYGKLRNTAPIWLSALITSVLFGAIHGQWNVGIDVFILSLVACGLREFTGSIWAGIVLHIMKNGLAFYVLFINPSILHTMGG